MARPASLLSLFLIAFLCGCSTQQPADVKFSATSQDFKGRDYAGKRFSVYRARVPDSWIRHDPLPNETLTDTTKALCELIIKDSNGIIRIAIHNFPTEAMEQRIPPNAQVARWQRQFETLSSTESSIIPEVFSGYSGLLFKGVGKLNGDEMMVLGWSLVIAPEHYRTLSAPRDAAKNPLYREMRADVTIKAVGPRAMMEQYESEIGRFARSFELIEEVPVRT